MNATMAAPLFKQTALSSALEDIRDHLNASMEGDDVTVNFYQALRLLIEHHSGPRLGHKEGFSLQLLFSTVALTKSPVTILDNENRAFGRCNIRLKEAGTAIADLIWFWSASFAQRTRMRAEYGFNDQLRHARLALNDLHNMVLLDELNGRRPAKTATNPEAWEPARSEKPDYFDEGVKAGLRLSLASEMYT